MAQSLHNAVQLTLGMEQQDYRVQRPWSATVAPQSQVAVPLAAGTRIIEVFDRPEIDRQLLILGEPGAGKTTMMLELAQDLVQRAAANKAEPIPVLISLSSWKNPQEPIFNWLVAELKSKYGIRLDLAQRWLEENLLLPLLDGLDEVAPQHQQACAVALNAWMIGELTQRPPGVLICCRREEFEQVVQQPLSLYGAIYLQALTAEQIADYFAQLELQDVWQTVQQDEALQELLTTPLFLSMFGLVQTQGKFSLSDWRSRTTSDHKIEYLLDTYWDAAIERELILNPAERQRGIRSKTYGKKALPTRKAVRRSLVFAAKMLDRADTTELLIEKIQPAALINRQQKWIYRLIVGLIGGLIVGLIGGLIVGLIGGLGLGKTVGLIVGMSVLTIVQMSVLTIVQMNGGTLVRMISGLTGGQSIGLDTIESVEAFSAAISHEALQKVFRSHPQELIVGLGFGIISGMIGGLSFGRTGGMIVGMIVGMIGGLRVLLKADIQARLQPNQGIKNSLKNIIISSAIVPVLALLLLLLEFLPISRVDPTDVFNPDFYLVGSLLLLLIFLIFWVVGGEALIKHLALRLVLAWNRYAPFRYDLLLNYCTERLLLQRVGGRYRFMHKLLQDHFAKMDLE